MKLYYTKTLSNQASSLAQDWILSSRGQESQHLSQLSNNISSWRLIRDPSGQGKDTWSSSSLFSYQTLFLLYFTNSMLCFCVWSVKRDTCANQGLCPNLRFQGDLLQFMAETLSGDYTNLLMSRGTQCLLQGMARDGQSMWTELSFLRQAFPSLWPFHNFLGIRTANLIWKINLIC